MQKLLHLFIGDREVEFSSPPDILYTYQQSDLTNPTVVKNSFSKTITIEGTPSNNQIFGHYWSVERLQNTSEDGSGVYFNASKKVPFILYMDSEIYEQGYVKLDNVKMVNHAITYSITLYGGLGDFFYSLSTDSEGNKKKLSSLEFDTDLEFVANIKTVKEAWESLSKGDSEKWDTINFMPAYNGLPDDFDADKVIFNTSGTSFEKYYYDKEAGNSYAANSDFVVGELPNEMTEWEMFDLRSYLQRPCIRMQKIIEACCKPENNGGYEVVLDTDFFNGNNPYWEYTWLSLPMIQSLEYKNDLQEVEDSILLNGSFDEGSTESGKMFQELYYNIGNMPERITSSFSVSGYMTFNGFNTIHNYPYTSYVWYTDKESDYYYSGHAEYGSLFIQLLAFNGDTIVGASQTYNLTSTVVHGGDVRWGHNGRYDENHKYESYMGKPIYNSFGWNNKATWCYEGTENPINFNFEINGCNSNITNIKLCYFWGSSKDKIIVDFPNGFFDNDWMSGKVEIHGFKIAKMGDLKFNITSSSKAIMGESLGRTGTKVTKELLLNTESSPCEYLLSYCKMFGLYFRKDIEEKKIYIETRKTFYDRSSVIDLSDIIDRSKDYSITPLTFDTKWYEFKQSMDKTDFYEMYFSSRGVEYGSKVLNTGYEFIADKKNLLDTNVIKSGIEGLEKSRYFTTYNSLDNKERLWFPEMTYELYGTYGTDGTYEMKGKTSVSDSSPLFGINEGEGMKYYDLFPKLQFHDKKNATTDGNNVLVFFSGFKKVKETDKFNYHYILSDDNQYQTVLNEATPCWLYTNYEMANNIQICYFLDELPVFERYYTSPNSTTVKKSLDFGTPQELYVPNYSITEDSNIYTNFWKTYLEDMFDVNTRVLTCYARIIGKPNPNWLRRFYWFDNAIWRLYKIVDWNVGSDDTTKMEFIKVQDLDDYTSITQNKRTQIQLSTPVHILEPNGQNFVLSIEVEPINGLGNKWRIINPQSGNEDSKDNYVILSRSNGSGNGSVDVTVSANDTSSGRTIYLTAVNDDGQMASIALYQTYNGETSFVVTPLSFIVGAEQTTKEVTFRWAYQYNNKINNYIDEGDIDILGVSFEESNKAIISINSNEDNYVKSEKITFTSGVYENTIGIDQLPTKLEFDYEGKKEYTLKFNYNKPTISNIPYWITVSKISDYEFKLTAKPNLYEIENNDTISIDGVYMTVTQGKGNAIGSTESSVNPNNFYLEKEGGQVFVSINISGEWTITRPEFNWIRTNQANGVGNSILQIRVNENTDVARNGIIIVNDVKNGTQFPILIYQEGSVTNPTFELNPSSTTVSKEGGTVRATFTYTDRGSDYITTSGEGVSIGNIIWNGVDGYCDIVVPYNDTIVQRTFEVIFTNQLGDFTFSIVQEAGDSTLSVAQNGLVIGYEGGLLMNGIISNTSWAARTSTTWIHLENTVVEGSGNQVLEMNIDANTSTADRQGKVIIETTDGLISEFTVSQRQFVPEIKVTPSSLTTDSNGGSYVITIDSNTLWNIE